VGGQVEAVGKNVTQFKAGDEVLWRGSSFSAEYACARDEDWLLASYVTLNSGLCRLGGIHRLAGSSPR